jgi:signal transduction histidine kinase
MAAAALTLVPAMDSWPAIWLRSSMKLPAELAHRFRISRTSLRTRVALGVALPIFISLVTLSLVHYLRERQLLEAQVQRTAIQIGEVTLGGLRHAMLENDQEHLAQVITDVSQMENINRTMMIEATGLVVFDSAQKEQNQIRHFDDLGCKECHSIPITIRPRTTILPAPADTLRISAPIENEVACRACHINEDVHLGMLLMDVSLVDTRAQLVQDLKIDLAISAGSTILITAGIYWLTHRIVVRRVEAFRRPLAEYAAGAFSSRLPVPVSPKDELDELAVAFNQMAKEIQRHAHEQEEQNELRQQAIIEERERIAREMHDGIAQLLGYVNTKAMAVRLMLENHKIGGAMKHLLQLEEAARELFVEVRAAILDLKTTDLVRAGLANSLKDYIDQFRRLSDLEVDLMIRPEVAGLELSAEVELHLLRIIQEALSNVRKHASASQAWLSLRVVDQTLELTVGDDGIGFDPQDARSNHRPHFGLSTMQGRAEAIGASFDLDTELNAGTRITIYLPLKESYTYARPSS